MALIRRSDQPLASPFEGAQLHLLAGGETGAKMLTVSDLTIQYGGKSIYHIHPNTEDAIVVIDGEIEISLGDRRFIASGGDCILARRDIGHCIENVGASPGRIIAVHPTTSPQRELLAEPDMTRDEPASGFFKRSKHEPYECGQGIWRYDMISEWIGAESTCISELMFRPQSGIHGQLHPPHEVGLFCLDGNLDIVLDNSKDVALDTNDMFICEPGTRYDVNNNSQESAKLLMIYPVCTPE